MSFNQLVDYANYMDEKGYKIAANAIDLACQTGENDYDKSIRNLAIFATWLNVDDLSDQVDTFLKLTSSNLRKNADLPDASHLYDTKKHKEESVFTALVDEARKDPEPELETWKGGPHPLLTRYSPDYPGVMMQRISDGVYQDLLSKKVYDFKNGFISDTGERYYGGSVSYQTPTAQNYLNSPQVMDSKHLRVRPR